MMRTAVWMVVVGLGGCGEPLEPGMADDTEEAGEAFASPQNFDPFPPPGQLCSWRRTIVYAPGFSCPAATNWKPVKVFPTAVEQELRHYCRYSFTKVGEPTSQDLALLPSNRSPDCLVVTPLASEDWVEMREAFRDQIDTPDLRAIGPSPITTWVAVVDSSPRPATPDGEAARGTNPHGYVLARILREAACPSGSSSGEPCAVRIHHELALPWSYDGVRWFRPPAGGNFGYQSELAEAIHRAVDAFTAANVDGRQRLIVNLSVGWLPVFGGDRGDSPLELPGAREVYAAIQKARCKGALIFAAAGNWSGGTQFTTGPLYPAGWSRFAAPGANKCGVDFGGVTPGYNETGSLLEAVGGVDGRDQILPNARPNSMPRMVAPGFLGAAADPLGAQIPTLTGTSVSTAVASAAAAVAWSYTPSLDSQTIATAVYQSGPVVDADADPPTCRETGCLPVRRVSVCGALQRACTDPFGRLRPGCVPIACSPRPPFADARPLLFAHMMPPTPTTVSLHNLASVGRAAPLQCGTTDALYRPIGSVGPGPLPCPDQQSYAGVAHPDVGGQPSGAGCRVCAQMTTPSNTMVLFVQLDPTFTTVPVQFPSLLLVTTAGTFRFALWEAAPGLTITADTAYALVNIPLPPPVIRTSILSARLTGRTARGEAWSAELAPLAGP
jgi:hypothetical protein